jgi:hypothetical protein
MSQAQLAEFSRIREEQHFLDHLRSNLFNHLVLVLVLLQVSWILGRAYSAPVREPGERLC